MKLLMLPLLSVLAIILISGCTNETQAPQVPSCPSSCDDGNICTRDYCSNETAYRCRHEAITPCCGNQICETLETYQTCSDCPKPRISTKDPSEMVLKLEDLPTGFSVNVSRYRTKDEVSNESVVNGWKTGYWIGFEMMEEFTGIANYNSLYPIENISFPLEQTREQIAENNLSIISAPKIGDDSIAYKEVQGGLIPFVKYTIEFRKYDVYEVIIIAGIGGKVSADDVVKYAQIVESRIS